MENFTGLMFVDTISENNCFQDRYLFYSKFHEGNHSWEMFGFSHVVCFGLESGQYLLD